MAIRRPIPLIAALGATLALSSAGRIHDQNFSGFPDVVLVAVAAVAYAGIAAMVVGIVVRLSEYAARWLLVLTLIVASLFFVVAYAHLGPAYADSDEALDILGESLLEGFNPYELRTYLGNTISPMMGAGLLALPFHVVFGAAAWQNPFWVLVGAAVMYRAYGARITLLVVLITFASVGFSADQAFGGDYFVSGIILALAVHSFVRCLESRSCWLWLSAVFLGLACANRLSTLPFLAAVAAAVYGAGRLRQAVWPLIVAVAVAVSMFVPWWLVNPAVYAPLQRGHFAGPPLVQAAVVLVLAAVLVYAAAGPLGSDLTRRFSLLGPIFAATVAPVAVFMPQELYRVAAFLYIAVPLLVPSLQVGAREVDGSQRQETMQSPPTDEN